MHTNVWIHTVGKQKLGILHDESWKSQRKRPCDKQKRFIFLQRFFCSSAIFTKMCVFKNHSGKLSKWFILTCVSSVVGNQNWSDSDINPLFLFLNISVCLCVHAVYVHIASRDAVVCDLFKTKPEIQIQISEQEVESSLQPLKMSYLWENIFWVQNSMIQFRKNAHGSPWDILTGEVNEPGFL